MNARITEHTLTSDSLSAPRKAWIHRADDAKDCLLFLDGELYTDHVKAPEAIVTAQALGTLPPLTCVYLPNLSAADRHDVYTCNESFASFIALEMPRWIEREAGRFERLFLCGLSLSGLQSIFTASWHPGIFAGVLAQSPSAWWQEERLAHSMTPSGASGNRFWLSVGTHEVQENLSHPPTPLIQRTSQVASVGRLAKRMTEVGHEARYHEYNGGHDPVSWGGLNFRRH